MEYKSILKKTPNGYVSVNPVKTIPQKKKDIYSKRSFAIKPRREYQPPQYDIQKFLQLEDDTNGVKKEEEEIKIEYDDTDEIKMSGTNKQILNQMRYIQYKKTIKK